MLSRGELRGRILRFLNKSSDYSGFYSTEKVNDAIQEALDAIAVHMFMAGEGWMVKIAYLDTADGQVSVDMPSDLALIKDLRYKYGDVYLPLTYDDQSDANSYAEGTTKQAVAGRYKLIGSQIVFDPPLASGGSRYLQIEGVYYPAVLKNDLQIIDPQFDNAMFHYAKYKCASILSSSLEKMARPWAQEESEWWTLMQTVLNTRNKKSTRIKEFL